MATLVTRLSGSVSPDGSTGAAVVTGSTQVSVTSVRKIGCGGLMRPWGCSWRLGRWAKGLVLEQEPEPSA